jgi:hypothetical protein
MTDPIDENEDDPIVAEVRQVREELAKRFNYDLKAICEDARRRTEEARLAGRKVVSLPPRRPEGWTKPAKKAG